LFCHGNAGNIGHRLEKALLLRKLKLNIFLIDYRGYGNSAGRPSEAGLYLDAQAGYDYLVNQLGVSPDRLILYGESLGSAAIIDLAAKSEVAGLIVEGGFTRGRDMAKRIYPFLPAFLFANSFDSLSKVDQISAPKLFIHSRNDEIVSFKLAQRLYQAAAGPKQFQELIGPHNSAFYDSKDKYIASLESFIIGLGGP
ncbi:alpha/beta hydrolase, partial [Candidatus Omnitrophota bacterium]